MSNSENSINDDNEQGYEHENGMGSDQMESLLNETLSQYPAHFQASRQILETVTAGQRGWRCTGAMETALTEEGMEVTFDYRRVEGYWRRFLIVVTMQGGHITKRSFNELKPGEHSGIAAFEGAQN